jgi:hypothetical protein
MIRKIFVAALLTAGLVGQARAGLVANGSVGFVPVGTVSSDVLPVSGASSVTLPNLETVNTLSGTSLASLGDSVTLSELNIIQGGSLVAETITVGTYVFTFSAAPTTASGNQLGFDVIGTFHDTSGTYNDGTAEFTGSFTSGTNGSINASFTLYTPALVPEPSGLVLGLMGAGLFGGLVVSRRRKASA